MKPTKWHKVDQLVVSYFKIVLYPQKKTKQVDVKMLSHEQCVSLLFKNAPLPTRLSATGVISVQFSRSVVSDSLQPHESQHARPPCPSQLLEFTQTHVHRVSDAICPLSSPSPPAHNPSQHQSLFQ